MRFLAVLQLRKIIDAKENALLSDLDEMKAERTNGSQLVLQETHRKKTELRELQQIAEKLLAGDLGSPAVRSPGGGGGAGHLSRTRRFTAAAEEMGRSLDERLARRPQFPQAKDVAEAMVLDLRMSTDAAKQAIFALNFEQPGQQQQQHPPGSQARRTRSPRKQRSGLDPPENTGGGLPAEAGGGMTELAEGSARAIEQVRLALAYIGRRHGGGSLLGGGGSPAVILRLQQSIDPLPTPSRPQRLIRPRTCRRTTRRWSGRVTGSRRSWSRRSWSRRGGRTASRLCTARCAAS